MKKLISLLIIFGIALMSGCMTKDVSTSKKVIISIGEWPTENRPSEVERYNEMLNKMNKKYPNIEIVPDEWAYDVNTFVPKAAGGMLPTMYSTYLTEIKKIIDAGFCADVTDTLKEAGYLDAMNEKSRDLLSKDGRVYGVPQGNYYMGLAANVELFRQAGLLDENGVPKFPNTYEELAQTASEIKKKTGKAGFVFPTINNTGGWHFMNVAWSFGVEFMKQENGKWFSTFNSPEAIAALQYIKDLKWKYDVFPDNTLIDIPEMQKMFATDQGAMYFSGGGADVQLTEVYSMDKSKFSITIPPKGPKGRYALTGGKAHMFSPNATPEQIDACLKWINLIGQGPEFSEEESANFEELWKGRAETGRIIGSFGLSIWVNDERVDKANSILLKYRNIEKKMFEGYDNVSSVTIRPEEPMCCQDLYKILDSCIQEVITNKDADVSILIEKASNDFQKNYLDNLS